MPSCSSINCDRTCDHRTAGLRYSGKASRNFDAHRSIVLDERPELLNHNVETVPRLFKKVQPQDHYEWALKTLENAKKLDPLVLTKSGIMLGLGESKEEVLQTMQDLRNSGVDVITLGQYLQPTKHHHEVIEFIHPDTFAFYREEGLKRGLKYVESGPLVRSSYHAERHVNVPLN